MAPEDARPVDVVNFLGVELNRLEPQQLRELGVVGLDLLEEQLGILAAATTAAAAAAAAARLQALAWRALWWTCLLGRRGR